MTMVMNDVQVCSGRSMLSGAVDVRMKWCRVLTWSAGGCGRSGARSRYTGARRPAARTLRAAAPRRQGAHARSLQPPAPIDPPFTHRIPTLRDTLPPTTQSSNYRDCPHRRLATGGNHSMTCEPCYDDCTALFPLPSVRNTVLPNHLICLHFGRRNLWLYKDQFRFHN